MNTSQYLHNKNVYVTVWNLGHGDRQNNQGSISLDPSEANIFQKEKKERKKKRKKKLNCIEGKIVYQLK